ncbi:MAG: sigma-54 dependent transcriptional regulator [Desulfobacteria bacterium]
MMVRILVIDDEEGIRFTFRKFLSDKGYTVVTSKTFKESLARIGEADFDLIITDIVLEGRNGIDILREVKERNPFCPVVMITGYPDIETAAEALRLGAFDYLIKPVVKDRLLRVATMALQHKAVVDEKERYRLNLEAIFGSVKDAIITVDNELVVVEVNEAAKSICGFSHHVTGKGFASQLKSCNGKCLEALKETIDKKQPVERCRIECSNNKWPGQVVTITTSPLISRRGVFSGAVMVVRDETHLVSLERDLRKRRQFHGIIGKSDKIQKVYSLIEDLCGVETTVLITGESGTGKELVAEALHHGGVRSNKPLVKVNCSALSENLLESELFGHVKGAFTGAVQDRIGRFRRAGGGTIFLDEIGDISFSTQLRLLRVLSEKEFERVGDSTSVKVDVRIVAATNQDLREKVRQGEYREDLYYRLRVVEVTLPPLRERREDLSLLVDHFLKKFNQQFNKNIAAVSSDVMKLFMDYPWPGNVRELEHSLEHAFVLCRQSIIGVNDLPPEFKEIAKTKASLSEDEKEDATQALLQALEKTDWNKAKAARLLGISRQTLYRKIELYNIVQDEL